MPFPIQRALLIDDDEIDNSLHRRVLEKSEIVKECIEFGYADDALEYLREKPRDVDLILLDVNMPRMNGFQFLEEYGQLESSHQARVLVMMISVSLSKEDHQRAESHACLTLMRKKPLMLANAQQIVKSYFSNQP